MSLPKRQTSLLCLTLVATAIFGWQLIELFTHDIVAAPPKQVPTQENSRPVPTPVMTTTPPTLSEEDRDFQSLLRRYELAKLQHRLADEELAIAKAQQAIHEIKQTTPAIHSDSANADWQLKYVGRHQQTWSASVAHGDRLVNITAGMKLNSHLYVTRIDAQGVWLRSPTTVYQLTFTGMTRVNSLTPPATRETSPSEPLAVVTPSLAVTTPSTPTTSSVATPSKITAPKSVAVTTPSFDETVLMAMPNHSYTLKLATHSDKQTLLHLIHKHKINSRSFIYAHPCDQQRCYSLVYGDYLTLPAAQAAQASLPTKLRELNPEITSLRAIQKSLQHEV